MGPTALGSRRQLPGIAGIGKSVAIKFDLFQNPGRSLERLDRHFCRRGPANRAGSIDLTGSGINLHSGDMMDANIAYDGDALTLTITDLVTHATWSHPFVIDIPSIVGGNTAYVGFTAGTGG